MKKLSVLVLEPSDHGEIRVEVNGFQDVVEISQGDHRIWVPKADMEDFCQHLTDWREQNRVSGGPYDG